MNKRAFIAGYMSKTAGSAGGFSAAVGAATKQFQDAVGPAETSSTSNTKGNKKTPRVPSNKYQTGKNPYTHSIAMDTGMPVSNNVDPAKAEKDTALGHPSREGE